MKKFLFAFAISLSCTAFLYAQKSISPCATNLLETVQRLVSGVTDTCKVGEYTTINAFGTMSTACFGSVEKKGTVSFTAFYYPDSTSVRVIWGNEKWVYDYYAACAPRPIIYEAPEGTQNHVYELRFLPVAAYNKFTGDKTTWASLKDLQTFKVSDIASITNIKLDAPNSTLARKEKADYDDLFSSKGIRCTVKLKGKRGSLIECYIYNNYDKAGTMQWKGTVDTEETPGSGYVKFNCKLPFSNYYKDYWVQKDGHNYILNGDIIVGNDLPKPRSLGSDDRDHHWPGGQIPVMIDVSIYEKNQQKIVSDALNTLNSSIELCFVLRTTQEDYVRIRNVASTVPGAAGSSPVGRQGDEQFVNLSDGATKGNVMHELLHAAGFYHEQSREDRGKFVNIVDANVQATAKNNFQLEPGRTQGTYDYCSVMHYSAMAFGKTDAAGNRLTTIQCKDANGAIVACPNCMGQRDSVTFRDVRGVDAFYNEISQFACGVKFDLVGATNASKNIAAVSRIPSSMETWWIDDMGSVQASYWYDSQYWVRYTLGSPGSASAKGGITAVSRIPTSMEVWWIGGNGSVWGAFWYEGSQWKRYELAPAGSAALNSKITAVSRIKNSMELWWVAPNGSVQGAFWYEGSQWKRYELAPAGSAAAEGGIAVSSRIPTSMEVWWIAPNGSVQAAFWYEKNDWKRYELAPGGSASTTGGLAAVSRIPTSMEVWWIGGNGSVQGAFWYENNPWKRYELAPGGSASLSSSIDAVSRVKNSLELWFVGGNGSIQGRYWYDNSTWKGYELAPAGSANTGSGIAATSRVSGSMEFFWVGSDGSIQDNFWYDTATWKRFTLAPKR